jgi:hypothetical protein
MMSDADRQRPLGDLGTSTNDLDAERGKRQWS